PAIADVLALLRLLAHLGDHRVTGHRREKAVDVDAAKALREPQMLLRRQLLIAEKDNAVLAKGAADLGKYRLGQRRRQIDPADLGAERAGEGPHLDMVVIHGKVSERV